MESGLAANWLYVRGELPDPPSRVLEIGCGHQGGFVPLMLEAGYDAVGVDPAAPEGAQYQRTEFERSAVTHPLDAVVACACLHHVADLHAVLGKVEGVLTPQGRLIVVEWDWERFDDETALWCFARVVEVASESDHGWLRGIRDDWAASGQPWRGYLRAWAAQEGLHTAEQMLSVLDAHFKRRSIAESPYFFPDLLQTSEADEQAAIDSGQIQATGIRYVGHVRS